MSNLNVNVLVKARPESVELAISRTAVIVVDLQNGYVSPGGYRDLRGRDIAPAKEVVENTLRLLEIARRMRMAVVFLQNGWTRTWETAVAPSLPIGISRIRSS